MIPTRQHQPSTRSLLARLLDRTRWLANVLVGIWRREGIGGFVTRAKLRTNSAPGYLTWVRLYDTLSLEDLERLAKRSAALPQRPLISVVMPVHETIADHLREAIASVQAQIYDRWELCIADDGSQSPHVRAILEAAAAADTRIKIVKRREKGHISHASNDALALASGDWVAMLDHDDILRPHALFCMVEAITRRPDAHIAYSDEDKITDRGRRFEPYFKPDFSLDLLLGQNYLNHLTLHRRANIEAVGGWRPGFEGAQDYDLTLRILGKVGTDNVIHVPRILYHWRATAGSTARGTQEKRYAVQAGLRALQDYAASHLPGAAVTQIPHLPYYRVSYPLPTPVPLVSIIIAAGDQTNGIERCLSSLFERTNYPNIEVIILDSMTREPGRSGLIESWRKRYGDMRVIPAEIPAHAAANINHAVRHASGDIVCLLSGDIEVRDPEWLSEMVSLAAQPGVGCVSGKVLTPGGHYQETGATLGACGAANSKRQTVPEAALGYFARLQVRRTVSAVRSDCLVVRRLVHERIGGFDETMQTSAFIDADFGLKARQAGYRNVWTPFAQLTRRENLTSDTSTTAEDDRGLQTDSEVMKSRWGSLLLSDPFHSPNLSLTGDYGDPAFPPRLPPLAGIT